MKNTFVLLMTLLTVNTVQARVNDNVYRMPPTGNLPGWGAIDLSKTAAVTGILGTAQGGTGNTTGAATTNANLTGPITSVGNATSVASQTGTGTTFVMNTSPTLVTPNIGTPSAGVLTNATGLPISSGVSGLGSGMATFLGTPTSANLAATVTNETGSGALVFATSPALVTPDIGTPSAGVLTNATGLPVSTGISGFGSGVATFLGSASSANLAAAITDETGSGSAVFATSPTLVTPALGTPSALVGTNITGTASALSIGGNAATSTALAATPTQCGGGQFATGIAASGNANCSSPAGGGTVTSVGLSDASTSPIFTITNSPVTGSGTLTETLATQTARTFFSGPLSGAAAQPTFKALTMPTITRLTSTGTATGKVFVLTTSPTVSAGATYTNNGNTFTVTYALAANTPRMYASGTGTLSGTTLTKATGTGPATLTLIAAQTVDSATYTAPTNPPPLYIEVEQISGGGGGGGGAGTGANGTGGSGTPSYFGGVFTGAGTGATGGSTTANGAQGATGATNFILANFTTIQNFAGENGKDGTPILSGTLTTDGGTGGLFYIPDGAATGAGRGGDGGAGGGTNYPGGGGGSGSYFRGVSTTMLTTYPYVVGTAGAGGTAAAGGNAGQAGGGGLIIVREYYQ